MTNHASLVITETGLAPDAHVKQLEDLLEPEHVEHLGELDPDAYDAIDTEERRIDCPYGCDHNQNLHPRDAYTHLLTTHLDDLPAPWQAVLKQNSWVTALYPLRTGSSHE